MLGTLVSLSLSPAPALGLSQVKKFYVFLMLIVIYNTFRTLQQMLWLVGFWAATSTAQALWSFQQFVDKQAEAEALGRNFYEYYVANRITGFLHHWMSFSAVQMLTLLVVLSVILFWPPSRKITIGLCIAAVLLTTSIVLGNTRSVWGAAAAGMIFLVWMWRPKMLLLLPVLGIALFFAVPSTIQERAISIYKPHGTLDSNTHRVVTTRIGLEIIKVHPWFGLGPDVIKRDFDKWVPADIPRPLPDGYYQHLHSIYIHYAADRGIPTMLMLLWFLIKIASDFAHGLRRASQGQKAFLCAGIAAVIAMMLEGFFEVNLGDSEPLAMFLAIVACGYVALMQKPEVECLKSS
jgi:O-antigen ligase